ncbi:MAG: hypothetical protein HY287_09825 [Planctomycetes bacterium]|nr:hypothetical protein [Planctomycetota bacterium]MBI3834612.1 hypothetical protein [Planctomycetota bacterium]
MEAETSVFDRIAAGLAAKGIAFTTKHHAPVHTSAEAAAVRGTTLHSGAKALIVKCGDTFQMIVLPADFSLDSKATCELLSSKKLRFASKEEVLQITGLTPGSIPPFGSLFKLPTICDERLGENESINFNAGSHTDSVQMTYQDYIRHETPRMANVGKPSEPA